MFTAEAIALGSVAAFLIGVSKTGLPGSGLVAIPLLAAVVEGRLIPGTTLPILLVADLFAVTWYRRHARWDVLGALAPSIGVGYLAGIVFFVAVGAADELLERGIGAILLSIVALQIWRTIHDVPPRTSRLGTFGFGVAGGFTTFVANAAGPVVNTYLAARRLRKEEFLGTAAWLYFVVNLTKIPFYVALGRLSEGGTFFTVDSLRFNLLLVPMIVAGVVVGRGVSHRLPQRVFLIVVLLLSAGGALFLLL